MKHCPQCNRVETDDTLAFCRVDGSPLAVDASAVNEIETSLLPHVSTDPGRQVSTAPTTTLPLEDSQATTNELSKAQGGSLPLSAPRKHLASTRNSIIAGALGVILVTALGVGSYFKYGRHKQINSIAVMPFVNESGNQDVEYLSDGM